MGQGMGQGGQEEGGLARADAAARVRGLTPQVGGGEDLLSWLGQNRRMSKDYERLCASAEAFIYAAMIRLMVRRLARV
jgi:transposase